MAVPDGDNLYDTRGTVLYRIVSAADYANELNGASSMSVTHPVISSSDASHQENTTGDQAGAQSVPGETSADTAAKAALLSMSARYSTQGELQRTTKLLSSVRDKNAAVSGEVDARDTSNSSRDNAATGGAMATTLGALGIAHRDGLDSELSSSDNPMLSHVTTVERALDKIVPPQPCTEGGVLLSADEDASHGVTADGVAHRAIVDDVGAGRQGTCATRTTESLESDERFVRAASLRPSSKLDVILLLQHLQRRCRDENARMCGVLCPTRENIFNDGMTELVRQITLLCPERGLLLDELDKSMAQTSETYDNLFDSAAQYGVLKGIERDMRKHLFDDRKNLESELRRHENRVNELRAKYNGMMKRFEEQKAATLAQHADELAYVKKANKQIVNEIKRLTALESGPASKRQQ